MTGCPFFFFRENTALCKLESSLRVLSNRSSTEKDLLLQGQRPSSRTFTGPLVCV